tara:strand:- start:1401 stop:2414 length:1014 start_codon:yes stop_codon:yes gene_type:complete
MKYYAVYKGYKTGVYENWDECFEQIKGYSSAMYKKCDNLNDAEYYYKNGVVNQEPKYEDLSKYFGGAPLTYKKECFFTTDKSPQSKTIKQSNIIQPKSNIKNTGIIQSKSPIEVYTDGGCINNGKANALAGVGVFFGNGDPRNISRRFKGKQSNNTAEINAMIDVSIILKKEIENKREVHIYYDSDYAMKACTSYGRKLASNGWTDKKPNMELVKKAYTAFKDKPNIKFKHIKAHTGKQDRHSLGNEGADMLATLAIRGKKSSITLSTNSSIKKKNNSYEKKTSNARCIYLNVPYSNKDEVKKMGALWNPKKKKWYIPDNHRNSNQLILKYGEISSN